jgi:putative endonuclease
MPPRAQQGISPVPNDRRSFVYVMASVARTLYVGVTSDLERRVDEHERGLLPGFSSRYRVTRLVHCEETSGIHAALAREREPKPWRRAKEIALTESTNPEWRDLAADWFEAEPPPFQAGPPVLSSRGAQRRGISPASLATSVGGSRDGRASSPAGGGLGMA